MIALDIKLQDGVELSPICLTYVRKQRNPTVILCKAAGRQDNCVRKITVQWLNVVPFFLSFFNKTLDFRHLTVLKIWQCRSNVDNSAQLYKILFNAMSTRGFFFLYMIILFKFEVAILKILYNTASLNKNLTLKVTGRMIFTLASEFIVFIAVDHSLLT